MEEKHFIESLQSGESRLTLDDIFSPGGALDDVLDNYTFRDSQLEMAKLIDEGFSCSRHVVIEAGTGIGKSFAYLVPAFLHVAADESKRVIIATSTTTLQKQLYDKDIPLVKSALGLDIRTAILFGRRNYLCLRRYQEIFEARKLLSLDESSPEARLDEWVANTYSGAIQDAPSNLAYLIKDLTSDEHDCMGKQCPYRDKCFFYGARKRAQRSNIVVTNHHIVLFDARVRDENNEGFDEECILPGYSYCVIDEAHHIQDEATSILSSAFSTDATASVLDDLTKKRSRYGNLSLLDYLSPFEKDERRKSHKDFTKNISHVRTMLSSFDERLNILLSRYFRDKSILFTKEFYDVCRGELSFGESLAEELKVLGNTIDSNYADDVEDANIDIALRYASDLICLSDTLKTWMRFNDFDSYIPYAEENSVRGNYTIKIAPMSTGPILNRVLLSKIDSLLYCSATLSVQNSFDYFSKDAGLKEGMKPLEGIFQSPFNYGSALMLLVPMDGMEYSKANTIGYNQYAAKLTTEAIKGSSGGALVLFTAKEMLRDVYRSVSENLGDEYKIYNQEERIQKAKLMEKFRNEENSSLFATDSFWEGFDAPGNTLRLVIIEKLPFNVPTNPIDRARSNYLEKQNRGSSFVQLTVPQASIKLKQGIGRLIRNEEDRGVVLILDKRILSKGYGNMMLNSIPMGYLPDDTLMENIPAKIERFLFG